MISGIALLSGKFSSDRIEMSGDADRMIKPALSFSSSVNKSKSSVAVIHPCHAIPSTDVRHGT